MSMSGDQMAAVAGGLGAVPPHADAHHNPVLGAPEAERDDEMMPDDPVTDEVSDTEYTETAHEHDGEGAP